MGVMNIQKYTIHVFQRQIMKNDRISISNESDDKVVYLQKWQHVITLKKQKKRQ